MTPKPHSELFDIVRGTIGMWRYKRDHEWDRRVDVALEALNDLEEQLEALREERDEWKRDWQIAHDHALKQQTRAEKAETRMDTYRLMLRDAKRPSDA